MAVPFLAPARSSRHRRPPRPFDLRAIGVYPFLVTITLEHNTAVVGLQWGDEGKGKIVDVLTEHADVVVRYCGGANAGHSVRIGGHKFATHLLPVGVFRSNIVNLIGNGVVLDPVVLFKEIDDLVQHGFAVTPANLKVSYKAHVVMPWHKAEDGARETAAEAGAIGTTKRGIGPTYADKMHRTTAIRVADLIDEARLKEKVARIVIERNKTLTALYDAPPIDWKATFELYRDLGRRLAPYVDDVGYLLLGYAKQGKKVVVEGAHAALLDVDHGTYPYVTSSNCSALGIYTGAGIPPQYVQSIIGVAKAYSTRVGGGPFPSELKNQTGDYIRERGREYGTTTGRPRRIGWFDAVAVKYSADLCGATSIAMTLLDVLSGLEHLQICTGYRLNGTRMPYFRADAETLAQVECIYETLPGWKANISGAQRFDELPVEAKQYVKRIEQLLEVPIRIVSVGPERSATLGR
jgi:adenylosuccinate synthase